MARKPEHHHKKPARHQAPDAPPAPDNDVPSLIGRPVFAQPEPTTDPTQFRVQHPSDNTVYKKIDQLNSEHKLNPMPFPMPRGYSADQPEPVLTLAEILKSADAVNKITAAGQIVFHAVGDTGNVSGPRTQDLVADKMVADFDEADAAAVPIFFLHLGDVIYNFGEAAYYYDQFYETYRNYPAPIISLAGNHDGMVAPGVSTPTLAAFLDNFCAEDFVVHPEAGGLSRTAQIQPGVFYTFEAPFLRVFSLYSNTLEDPGVIANKDIGDSQLIYLKAALTRAKAEKFDGALIIAHHHPAYTAGTTHGWSVELLAQIDKVCAAVGLWPHAVLSGHAHNYQRFTRAHGDTQIAYVIGGNGGHAVARLVRRGGAVLRTPNVVQKASGNTDQVTLESYDDANYGYLRLIASSQILVIEYHPASDGDQQKTPDDRITIDLVNRTIS